MGPRNKHFESFSFFLSFFLSFCLSFFLSFFLLSIYLSFFLFFLSWEIEIILLTKNDAENGETWLERLQQPSFYFLITKRSSLSVLLPSFCLKEWEGEISCAIISWKQAQQKQLFQGLQYKTFFSETNTLAYWTTNLFKSTNTLAYCTIFFYKTKPFYTDKHSSLLYKKLFFIFTWSNIFAYCTTKLVYRKNTLAYRKIKLFAGTKTLTYCAMNVSTIVNTPAYCAI